MPEDISAERMKQFSQAYRDFELFPLIELEEIEKFRVDYNTRVIASLRRAVDNAAENGKVIFVGHRGCGKSTLLYRFYKEMQQHNYFSVFFSIADQSEMSDVDHTIILYSIAINLLSMAEKRKVVIPEQTRQIILGWLTTTRSQTTTEDFKKEFGVGGEYLKTITARLKNESTFRQEVKQTFERRVTELVRKTDEIAALIQVQTKKKVLVVIDDLDKLDLPLARAVYRDHLNSLFLPNFRIVLTIPIASYRNLDILGGLQSAASKVLLMPVSKFFSKEERHNPNAIPNQAAMQPLLETLEKRISPDLIEAETAKQMVLKSGGVIRELVRLARECCNECMVLLEDNPGQEVKINQAVLNLAIRNIRNEFARPLGLEALGLLKETYEESTPSDAMCQEFLDLLHGLWVLEYDNDDVWYDVHPIVADLLKKRQLIN